ncbi:hypothetical protein OF83DRAFT_449396 [Amylostereum chailletii]|nr:hypothetical protein OF83DRAFT_449396 [Amylostereum chailletii]
MHSELPTQSLTLFLLSLLHSIYLASLARISAFEFVPSFGLFSPEEVGRFDTHRAVVGPKSGLQVVVVREFVFGILENKRAPPPKKPAEQRRKKIYYAPTRSSPGRIHLRCLPVFFGSPLLLLSSGRLPGLGTG